MANNKLFSKLMNITIDSSTVACATDFSWNITKDTIDIACLDSTGSKESVPDMYSYTVSGSGLVFRTAGADSGSYGFYNMVNNLIGNTDASVAIAIIPDVSLNEYLSGAGYFTSLSQTGGIGAAVSYSFEIKGTGPLSVLTTN